MTPANSPRRIGGRRGPYPATRHSPDLVRGSRRKRGRGLLGKGSDGERRHSGREAPSQRASPVYDPQSTAGAKQRDTARRIDTYVKKEGGIGPREAGDYASSYGARKRLG